MNKSAIQPTQRLHIGDALWDGFLYPFRKPKLIRSSILLFLYVISAYFISFLIITLMNSELSETYKLSQEIFVKSVLALYFFFLIPFIGYLVTIIQQSLKDDDKPPRIKNLKRILVFGIKAFIPNIFYIFFPKLILEFNGDAMFLFNVLNKLSLETINIQQPVTLIESASIYKLLILYCVDFSAPAIFVTFSRRGYLSDLLPINQYVNIFKDQNYILISILYTIISFIEDFLLNSILKPINNIFLSTVIILCSNIYIFIVLNRIIGKQWRTIKNCYGNRKLLCDTTIQRKLDGYFKK